MVLSGVNVPITTLIGQVRHVIIREALFADDIALATHSGYALQKLINLFSKACNEFGLTISINKTEVMGQGIDHPPRIYLGNYEHNSVEKFQYPGSMISANLWLEPEINRE